MRFADVIGNQEAVEALRNMVDSNRIPHAILLAGPEGIGKNILARAFIAYLNCENRKNGDSCGVCSSCKRIAAGNNPDLHEIYPIYKLKSDNKVISDDYREEWRRFIEESPYMNYSLWMALMNSGNSQPQISVEESSNIASAAALSSYADRFKVFLVWLPEKIGLEAANKLLKVIEEPYEDTLFICVSNDPGSILPTIYSRLRRIELKKPDSKLIEQTLLSNGVSPVMAANYARLAEGSLLKAFSLAANAGELEAFSNYFKSSMRAAYSRNAAALKKLSDTLAGLGREKCLRLLDYFARMTRENFIANLCVPPLNVMAPDEESFSSKFSPFINAANVETIISEINDAKRDISRNGNGKLVWFDFLLHIMIALRKK